MRGRQSNLAIDLALTSGGILSPALVHASVQWTSGNNELHAMQVSASDNRSPKGRDLLIIIRSSFGRVKK
jgi:hypothetical protein